MALALVTDPASLLADEPTDDLDVKSAQEVLAILSRLAIGKVIGLRFVYLGDAPGHSLDDTTCPKCGILLIQRWGLAVLKNRLEDGFCPHRRAPIPGAWSAPGRSPVGATETSRPRTVRISWHGETGWEC